MGILCSVFSYNRFSYLKNFVDSWAEFFRHGELLIIDDGSDDPLLLDYLKQVSSNSKISVIHVSKPKADGYMHGGLYHNMDLACSYALQHGYKYLYFAQDDNQFVWYDPYFLEKIEKYFDVFPNLCMVQNRFMKGVWRKIGRLSEKIKYLPEGDCFQLAGNSMLDVGIIKVELINKLNFKYALGNESSNGLWWRFMGYHAVLNRAPNMCFVPEPATIRERLVIDSAKGKNNKYYMKPLNQKQIQGLLELPSSGAPIDEDWCHPWGWHCEKPYYDRSEEEYYKKYYKRINFRRYKVAVKTFRRIIPLSIRSRAALLLRH